MSTESNPFLSGDIGNTAKLDPDEFNRLFNDIIEGTPIRELSLIHI